jgi:hypothetical protein
MQGQNWAYGKYWLERHPTETPRGLTRIIVSIGVDLQYVRLYSTRSSEASV